MSALVATGGGRLVAVVTVAGDGQPVMPCGRCRQLLWEHGGPDCLVDGDGTARPMREVLPGAFEQESMAGPHRALSQPDADARPTPDAIGRADSTSGITRALRSDFPASLGRMVLWGRRARLQAR